MWCRWLAPGNASSKVLAAGDELKKFNARRRWKVGRLALHQRCTGLVVHLSLYVSVLQAGLRKVQMMAMFAKMGKMKVTVRPTRRAG